MNGAVTVSAPARLHFGLLRFEDPHGLSYGGLGMMIRDPRTEVRVLQSEHWACSGRSANAALATARRCAAALGRDALERFAVQVLHAAPRHRGFGSGTQLALAVSAGLHRLMGLEIDDAAKLAQAAGRARRSAIGTHGFLHGGLLWEHSRAPGEPISPLEARASIPGEWRVLLLMPHGREGRHGSDETNVFERVPPIPAAVSDQLESLATQEILPAAAARDFDRFASHVAAYGETAGNCFRSVQGGPFANQQVADLVDAARDADCKGVGQTSWGPTVFAFAEDQDAAEAAMNLLSQKALGGSFTIAMTQAENRGATLSESEPA